MARRRFLRIGAAAAGPSVMPLSMKVKAETGLVTLRDSMLGAIATHGYPP